MPYQLSSSSYPLGTLFILLCHLLSYGTSLYYRWEPLTINYGTSIPRYNTPLGYIPWTNTFILIGGSKDPLISLPRMDVLVSTDGGYNWFVRSSVETSGLFGHSFLAIPNDLLYCHTGGVSNVMVSGRSMVRSIADVYCTKDDGYTWSSASWSLPFPVSFHSIALTNDNTLYLAGGVCSDCASSTRVYKKYLYASTDTWTMVTNDWGIGQQYNGRLYSVWESHTLLYALGNFIDPFGNRTDNGNNTHTMYINNPNDATVTWRPLLSDENIHGPITMKFINATYWISVVNLASVGSRTIVTYDGGVSFSLTDEAWLDTTDSNFYDNNDYDAIFGTPPSKIIDTVVLNNSYSRNQLTDGYGLSTVDFVAVESFSPLKLWLIRTVNYSSNILADVTTALEPTPSPSPSFLPVQYQDGGHITIVCDGTVTRSSTIIQNGQAYYTIDLARDCTHQFQLYSTEKNSNVNVYANLGKAEYPTLTSFTHARTDLTGYIDYITIDASDTYTYGTRLLFMVHGKTCIGVCSYGFQISASMPQSELNKNWNGQWFGPIPGTLNTQIYSSCYQALVASSTAINGIYSIHRGGTEGIIPVYCRMNHNDFDGPYDMSIGGGGWDLVSIITKNTIFPSDFHLFGILRCIDPHPSAAGYCAGYIHNGNKINPYSTMGLPDADDTELLLVVSDPPASAGRWVKLSGFSSTIGSYGFLSDYASGYRRVQSAFYCGYNNCDDAQNFDGLLSIESGGPNGWKLASTSGQGTFTRHGGWRLQTSVGNISTTIINLGYEHSLSLIGPTLDCTTCQVNRVQVYVRSKSFHPLIPTVSANPFQVYYPSDMMTIISSPQITKNPTIIPSSSPNPYYFDAIPFTQANIPLSCENNAQVSGCITSSDDLIYGIMLPSGCFSTFTLRYRENTDINLYMSTTNPRVYTGRSYRASHSSGLVDTLTVTSTEIANYGYIWYIHPYGFHCPLDSSYDGCPIGACPYELTVTTAYGNPSVTPNTRVTPTATSTPVLPCSICTALTMNEIPGSGKSVTVRNDNLLPGVPLELFYEVNLPSEANLLPNGFYSSNGNAFTAGVTIDLSTINVQRRRQLQTSKIGDSMKIQVTVSNSPPDSILPAYLQSTRMDFTGHSTVSGDSLMYATVSLPPTTMIGSQRDRFINGKIYLTINITVDTDIQTSNGGTVSMVNINSEIAISLDPVPETPSHVIYADSSSFDNKGVLIILVILIIIFIIIPGFIIIRCGGIQGIRRRIDQWKQNTIVNRSNSGEFENNHGNHDSTSIHHTNPMGGGLALRHVQEPIPVSPPFPPNSLRNGGGGESFVTGIPMYSPFTFQAYSNNPYPYPMMNNATSNIPNVMSYGNDRGGGYYPSSTSIYSSNNYTNSGTIPPSTAYYPSGTTDNGYPTMMNTNYAYNHPGVDKPVKSSSSRTGV